MMTTLSFFMRKILSGWLWVLVAAPIVAVLGGCSASSILYNNAPTAVNFFVDGYLDLDNGQESLLKERIAKTHAWHRSTQLKDYAVFLGEVKKRSAGTISRADIAWLYEQVQARYRTLGLRVVDDIGDLTTQLTPENLKAMEAKFAKVNDEYARDFLRAKPESIRKKRIERVRENIEDWSGPLNDTQLARLEQLVDKLPMAYALVLEDRQRRQKELLGALQAAVGKSAPREEVRARLTAYVTDWERGRSPAYREWVSRFTPASQEMFAEMVNSMTATQRERAQKRMQGYIDDLNTLALPRE
jgi:Family of unknown function (DUF6279)